MNLGADIFTVRTGRATVMIGLPAAVAPARGGTAGGGAAFGGPDTSQLIDLALGASGETHGMRQFCIRCGFPSHGVAHVGNRGLRDWLVNALRQGRLAAVLLPDVLFGAGAVQARTVEVRTDFAIRIDRVVQSQAGAQLRPLELIVVLQAGADQRRPGAGSNAPAGARPAGGQAVGQGRDLTPSDVRAMALEDRILEVIRRVLVAFEASANVRRQDLEPLVAPSRLAGTVAVLTAWADTHVGGVRALTDLGLRTFGRGGLDEETMFGLLALSQALARTGEALDPGGLEKAADRLARAITLLGPALQQLIACSTTLPVAVPVKTRALSLDRTPTRPPAERYWPRPVTKNGPTAACAAARQELQNLKEAQFHAKFANAAYDEKPPNTIGDYGLVTDSDELGDVGLSPEDLEIPGTSFKAVVYKQGGEYIVAFKGTTSWFGSDMATNYNQSVGKQTKYYSRAQEVGRNMVRKVGNSGQPNLVRFIGHSLGGGLASAAAVASGAPATTYNAAGLHSDTVEAPKKGGKVTAVRVKGEILTGTQTALPLPKAHSTENIALDPPFSMARDIAPMIFAALLQPIGVTVALLARAGLLHKMGSVEECLISAIKAAQRKVRKACGGGGRV